MKGILIVDNDKNIQKSITLQCKDEYEILCLEKGKEVLNTIETNHIECIILDIMLPDITGIKILRQIRENESYSNKKVIIMSAYSDQQILKELLQLHPDAYFDKPFNINELKRTIDRLVDNEEIPSGIDSKIEKVIRLIQKWSGKGKLEDIAKQVGISPKYLSRLFPKYVGYNFRDYCKKIKMEMALSLLKKGNFTVSEIAYKVGYQYPTHFTRAFKKIYRCNPKDIILKLASKEKGRLGEKQFLRNLEWEKIDIVR